jgi:hypothetical protein
MVVAADSGCRAKFLARTKQERNITNRMKRIEAYFPVACCGGTSQCNRQHPAESIACLGVVVCGCWGGIGRQENHFPPTDRRDSLTFWKFLQEHLAATRLGIPQLPRAALRQRYDSASFKPKHRLTAKCSIRRKDAKAHLVPLTSRRFFNTATMMPSNFRCFHC